jgi:triphosphoribosyl-dephospho-CoA synthase
LEATVPKPGNVHRSADFEDMTFLDFVVSATAIGPAMEAAVSRGVGCTVRDTIRGTRRLVRVNTNLGTVLLLAPLAAVPRERSLTDGVGDVLRTLTAADAAAVYEAIRLANPGGLGQVDAMDVAAAPSADLFVAMRAAADRDLVARQYVEDFAQVLQVVVPALERGQDTGWSLPDTVIRAQLTLLSQHPDSLIQRKCGAEVARRASGLARQVLEAGQPGEESYGSALRDLDFWLRTDGHRRNPGTTADLIAAGLFAALRDGALRPPLK